MAKTPNMKFWYVTVFKGSKTIFSKQCTYVKEANTLFEEKKKEYPGDEYIVMKENF